MSMDDLAVYCESFFKDLSDNGVSLLRCALISRLPIVQPLTHFP